MIPATFTILFLLGTFFTSLYPFSVREISLPLLEQSAARFGVFALLSAASLFFISHYKNWLSIFRYPIWIIAIVNAISTYTSYISYLKLNIGTAVTTYFIYPIFLFLLGVFFGKEKITKKKIIALLVAFAGVVVVHWNDLFVGGGGVRWNRDYVVGLAMILISAITSAVVLYYYNTRREFATTAEYLYNVYTIPFFLFACIALYRGIQGAWGNVEKQEKQWIEWAKLIGFNIIIGYVGYLFIYRALPRLSIYWVSLLSYSGIWMTILLDRIIMKVPLTSLKIIGSGLVILANVLFNK